MHSAPDWNIRTQSARSVSFRVLSGLLVAGVFVSAAPSAHAVTCTTQSGMQQADRQAILQTGNSVAEAVTTNNLDALQASILPAVTGDWDGIKSVAQSARSLISGGTITWSNAYLLDATDLKETADAQFFCTNSDSASTVTINLRSLPPGRYALMIGDSVGAPMAGQVALILGVDSTANGKWKLGGLFAREGAVDGHDGIWFWSRARAISENKAAPVNAAWSVWFSYDMARWLLIPVDFVSSPHLEKLNHEQTQNGTNPADSLPLTVSGDGGKSWHVTAIHVDTTLHHDDLGITYEGTGISDPAAARSEAIAVMSALLKLHPDLRENFHGLWAYAEKDGQRTFAIELAMHDIP